jgi:hypothetical protein
MNAIVGLRKLNSVYPQLESAWFQVLNMISWLQKKKNRIHLVPLHRGCEPHRQAVHGVAAVRPGPAGADEGGAAAHSGREPEPQHLRNLHQVSRVKGKRR